MQNKLQELTEKIYREGITKGEDEAKAIVTDAKKEAGSIVATANAEAENLLKEAKKRAEELKTNALSELKLSSKQALNSLKQQITDMVNGKVVNTPVTEAVNDSAFLRKMIEISLGRWAQASDDAQLTLLVPEKEAEGLKAHFAQAAKKALDKGLTIKPNAGLKAGFQVSPADGGYKISFTDEDFIAYFKHYLRPRLSEMLFSE